MSNIGRSFFNVIARSFSDEAIPRIEHFTWDCFVAFAPRNDISPKARYSLMELGSNT
ncbi:MAG: hypothetical protein FWC80_01575 [Firmicutes bacterium]|nr:hypothetical protein [Bacillota bacterium]